MGHLRVATVLGNARVLYNGYYGIYLDDGIYGKMEKTIFNQYSETSSYLANFILRSAISNI